MIRCGFVIPGDLGLPTGGYAYDRRVLVSLPEHGIDATHVSLPGSFPFPTDRDLAITLATLAAQSRQSVLLIDGLAYGAMPATLIERISQPVVALCHHPLCLETGLEAEQAVRLRSTETVALALAHHIVVVSPEIAQTQIAQFNVLASKISIAVPGTERAQRATGTQAQGGPLGLLAVGAVVPRKAHDLLVTALAPLAQLDWHLTIAGADDRSPEAARTLREAIERTGLQSRVTIAGAISDRKLAELYHRSDVFVSASLYEGYGMVLAEALARGLPIVCTTGGAAAQTAPDAAALKVPPGDGAALTAALRAVLSEPALRRIMSDAGWTAGQALPRWNDTAQVVAGALKMVAARAGLQP